MKATVMIKTDIDAKFVFMQVAVRYEEDIPDNFPKYKNNMWEALIDIDHGIIPYWPQGVEGRLYLKVCDQGTYELFDKDMKSLALLENDYVPMGLVPGKFGDYIDLKINGKGKVLNWNPTHLYEFFEQGR